MNRSRFRKVLLITLLVLLSASSSYAQTFFDDIYFGGASFPSSNDVSWVGWDWNDRISSVSIPAGTTVTLYSDIDFGGTSLTLTGDAVDLRNFPGPGPDGTWNDQVSSFRISGGGGQPPSLTTTTVLVNGSFVDNPDWVDSGHAMYQAIAATYGRPPVVWTWHDNSFVGVIFSDYSGIANGAYQLANFLDALPPGDINVVSHSHGGNVTDMATWIMNRRLKHIINLATPINFDLWYSRHLPGYPYGAESRCQASSVIDYVQFLGASPFQVQEFAYATLDAKVLYDAAIRELQNGNIRQGLGDAIMAGAYTVVAYEWWMSTKREIDAPTYMWELKLHGDMHEPDVWNELVSPCAIN